MKRINFRFVFIFSGLISLVILYLVIGIRVLSTPRERTGADFIAFYAAGMIARHEGASHVYDLTLQKTIEQEQVGFILAQDQVLIFNHDPYLIPILSLFVSGNYTLSFIRWILLLCMISALSIRILISEDTGDRRNKFLILLCMATFYPLFMSAINGQDTVFILLGLSMSVYGLKINKDWVVGSGLALATIRPQITLLLVLPFLFKRQKVFAYFFACALILGLMSFLTLGFDGLQGYLSIMRISVEGSWYGLKENVMVNLVGLLWRVFPGLGSQAIHWVGWAAYGISAFGLVLLWIKSREIGIKELGLGVVISLFVSPHLHYHDLTLLLVPATIGVTILEKKKILNPRDAPLVPLVLSLLFLFSSLAPILKYNIVYLIMLVVALVLWSPERLIFWRKKSNEIIP